MTSKNTVLATAANGNIGSELVPRLLSEPNLKLVLPTSNANRLQSKFQFNAPNVTVEEGSIKDPVWVQSILSKHKVSKVFLCLSGPDELLVCLNFLDAMQRAGCIQHLIYLSGCGDFVSGHGIRLLMQTCSATPTLVKSTLEQKLAYGNLPWKTTVLGPSLFFSNDLRSKLSILQHNVYAEPLGETGTSRVALRDIALAVRNIFCGPTPDKWAAKKIMIGSKHMYTGTEIANLWSQATGGQVKMVGCDENSLTMLEEYLAEVTGRGKDWGRALRLMYESFVRDGFGMSDEEYQVQLELLGREPEVYPAWVKEEGESWKEGSIFP